MIRVVNKFLEISLGYLWASTTYDRACAAELARIPYFQTAHYNVTTAKCLEAGSSTSHTTSPSVCTCMCSWMHGCGSILAQQSLEGSINFTWQGLNTALTSLYFALSCTEHRLWLLPSGYAYGCGFVYGYAYGYGYGYAYCIIYGWTRLSSSANLGLQSQVLVLKRSSFLCSACVGAHENGVYTYIIIQCVNTSSWYCTVTSHYM